MPLFSQFRSGKRGIESLAYSTIVKTEENAIRLLS